MPSCHCISQVFSSRDSPSKIKHHAQWLTFHWSTIPQEELKFIKFIQTNLQRSLHQDILFIFAYHIYPNVHQTISSSSVTYLPSVEPIPDPHGSPLCSRSPVLHQHLGQRRCTLGLDAVHAQVLGRQWRGERLGPWWSTTSRYAWREWWIYTNPAGWRLVELTHDQPWIIHICGQYWLTTSMANMG